MRSYALDALDGLAQATALQDPGPAPILARLAGGEPALFPAVGEGEELRFSASGLDAAALLARGRLSHSAAFPTARSEAVPLRASRMARPVQRAAP